MKRRLALPSDSLVVAVVEDAPSRRIYHAVQLAQASQDISKTTVTSLCDGWTGIPSYVVRTRRGWGVGAAGMYSDQKWCKSCGPLAKALKADLDAGALENVARKRIESGEKTKPRPPRTGESFAAAHPAFASQWVRCVDFPSLSAADVPRSAQINVEWRCSVRGHRNYFDQPSHVQAFLKQKKKPCPFCRAGLRPEPWTKDRVIELVRSIAPHIATLSAADRYILLLQTGILESQGIWASEIASSLLGSDSGDVLRRKLEDLTDGIATHEHDLEQCISDVRKIMMCGEWSETDRVTASGKANRRSLDGLNDMLTFWAGTNDDAWREASVAKSRLLPEDVVRLWRRLPSSGDASAEMRRCLNALHHEVTATAGEISPVQDSVGFLSTEWRPKHGSDDEQRSLEAAVDENLPDVSVEEVLSASDKLLIADQDQEALEYFVASQVSKLWVRAFEDAPVARAAAQTWSGTGFGNHVRDTFLAELGAVEQLVTPDDWRFRPDGAQKGRKPFRPRAMQALTAVRVAASRFGVGNWSLMGGGKTVSAVLAAATISSRLTMVICPNSTVDGWRAEILRVFPEALVSVRVHGWG